MLEKPHTPRSEPYKADIRKKICLSCGGPAPNDPHHMETGGVGIKGSDYSCIPLCRKCHSLVEDGCWQLLELRYGFTEAVAWRRAWKLTQEWFLKKGGSDG